jgi:hypothetical protein
VTTVESRADYARFHDPVFVPSGMLGTTPRCTGDCIVPGATFKSIRPAYANDVDYNRVEAAIAAGTAPTFTFHRIWAQIDVAMANSFWGQFFETCGGATATTPPTRTGATNTPTRVAPTRTNTPVVVPTNTPTRTGPTATRTRTRTPGGPTATRTRTSVPPTRTNTPTGPTAVPPTRTPTRAATTPPTTAPTRTNTPGSGGGTCSPATTVTAPFTFDGAGVFCWRINNIPGFINSWNLNSLTVNGVNWTNLWASTSQLPPKAADGYWYIAYNSSVAWGHFEAK